MTKNVAPYTAQWQNYAGKYRSQQAPTPPVGAVQTFNIENTEASTSKGFCRIGLSFKKGDFPEFIRPVIKRSGNTVDAQFDRRVTWSDGSLKFAVCHIRDTDFTNLENRTYTVEGELNLFDNTGTKTLSDITSNTDFKIEITNNQRFNGSTNEADPVGSSLFADFNTLSATATRVTKIHSGPVCETWKVWGMVNDGVSTDHAHLKTEWLVTVWKNANDTINDYEFGCVVAQDWFEVASKFRQDYDLTLKDNLTTVESYVGVQHPYRSRWATVDKTTTVDSKYAKRFWRTEAPTLNYKPDNAYLITTGLVIPYDINANVSSHATHSAAWTPCGNMNHRASIDATGGYIGRSSITNPDIVALVSQSALDVRYARTNAHAGLHIPYHHRTNKTRTRPSEGSDVANTIISQRMDPLTSTEYDFTADGMPASQYAYNHPSNEPQYNTDYVTPVGGSGVWTPSTNPSHAVNYSYFMYLLEGEDYFLDATLGLMSNTLDGAQGHLLVCCPPLAYQQSPYISTLQSIPSGQWSAIMHLQGAQSRSVGWALNILGSVNAVLPDDAVEKNYVNKLTEHQANYLSQSISYLPAEFVSKGIYYLESNGTFSNWMQSFITIGAAHAYSTTELTGFKDLLDIQGTYIQNEWNTYDPYTTTTYRVHVTEKTDSGGSSGLNNDNWHRDNNPFLSQNMRFITTAQVSSTTDVVTIANLSDTNNLVPQNDDRVIFYATETDGTIAPVPTEFTEGTMLWIVNAAGDGLSFQVSLTQGGAAIDFTSNYTDASIGFILGDVSGRTVATNPPYLPPDDHYSRIFRCAAVVVNNIDNTVVTDSVITKANTFLPNTYTFTNQHLWNVAKVT